MPGMKSRAVPEAADLPEAASLPEVLPLARDRWSGEKEDSNGESVVYVGAAAHRTEILAELGIPISTLLELPRECCLSPPFLPLSHQPG